MLIKTLMTLRRFSSLPVQAKPATYYRESSYIVLLPAKSCRHQTEFPRSVGDVSGWLSLRCMQWPLPSRANLFKFTTVLVLHSTDDFFSSLLLSRKNFPFKLTYESTVKPSSTHPVLHIIQHNFRDFVTMLIAPFLEIYIPRSTVHKLRTLSSTL